MTDEQRIAAVYRRLPPVSPDPATDARILAAARRAVAQRHSRLVPLAAAATLVLGVGVAWQVWQYQPSPGADAVSQPAREALPVEGPMPATGSAKVPPAPPSALGAQALRYPSTTQPESRSLREHVFADDADKSPASMPRTSAAGRPLAETARLPAAQRVDPCLGDVPDDGLSREQWLGLIEQAAEAGELDRQRCLEKAFADRFRPAPDG